MDKSKIHLAACEKLNHKIFFLEKIIHETRTSNQETKSSMGDKYETSREMIQQEIHHLQLQLNENFRYLKIIKKIQTNHHYKVQLGSLVQSENIFFLYFRIPRSSLL